MTEWYCPDHDTLDFNCDKCARCVEAYPNNPFPSAPASSENSKESKQTSDATNEILKEIYFPPIKDIINQKSVLLDELEKRNAAKVQEVKAADFFRDSTTGTNYYKGTPCTVERVASSDEYAFISITGKELGRVAANVMKELDWFSRM